MISRARRGYDAGKKINGTKRHIAVDTTGLLLTVVITIASVQDRDAATPLLQNLRRAFPQITLVRADGGYAGKLVSWAKTTLRLTLEIIRVPCRQPGSARILYTPSSPAQPTSQPSSRLPKSSSRLLTHVVLALVLCARGQRAGR